MDNTKIQGPTPCQLFSRYVGIDYSGAATAGDSLKGLRAYVAECNGPPAEILPEAGAGKYWSRQGIAEWLVRLLNEDRRTLVGIDHGFSFPLQYFNAHRLPLDWEGFLADFELHWPTAQPAVKAEDIRLGRVGNGSARGGNARWRRMAEARAGAKSVFHFDVPGSVAKSTHAGLPWLRLIRNDLGQRIHCWPFDGWTPPAGRSVVAEAYPSLCSRTYARQDRTQDQHDAYAIAEWMRQTDSQLQLARFFQPDLTAEEKAVAVIEGWILGVA